MRNNDTFAVKLCSPLFVPLAEEFVTFAIEFVVIALSFITLAIEEIRCLNNR